MQSLLEAVPWLGPVVYWLVAVSLVWLLASLPAAVLRRISFATRNWLLDLAHRVKDSVKTANALRLERVQRERSDILAGLGERPFDSAAHDAWLEDAAALKAPLTEAVALFSLAQESNDRALGGLALTTDVLRRTSSDRLQMPELPTQTAASQIERARSAAMLNLCIGLALLTPIVIGNAQLTALVLREAFPEVRGTFASIPPSFALAIIITIAEVAFGAIHGNVTADSEEAGRQYSPGIVFVSFLALVPIVLELLFYSQFRESGGSNFKVPLLDIEVPPGTAFGLLGLLLGSAVFFLGRQVYVAARTLVLRRSLKKTRIAYEGLQDVISKFHGDLRAGGERLQAVTNLQQVLESRHVQLASDHYQHEVGNFLASPPEWIKPVRRSLTAAEAGALESSAIVSSVVALVALAAATFFGVVAVQGAFRGLGLFPAAAVALIPVASMFYGGFLWGRSRHERSTTGQLRVPGVALTGLAVGVGIGYLAWSLGGWSTKALATLLFALSGVLLTAAGIALSGSASFVLLNARVLAGSLVNLLFLVGSALCYLIWLVVAFLDGAIALIAQPVELMATMFRRRVAE